MSNNLRLKCNYKCHPVFALPAMLPVVTKGFSQFFGKYKKSHRWFHRRRRRIWPEWTKYSCFSLWRDCDQQLPKPAKILASQKESIAFSSVMIPVRSILASSFTAIRGKNDSTTFSGMNKDNMQRQLHGLQESSFSSINRWVTSITTAPVVAALKNVSATRCAVVESRQSTADSSCCYCSCGCRVLQLTHASPAYLVVLLA